MYFDDDFRRYPRISVAIFYFITIIKFQELKFLFPAKIKTKKATFTFLIQFEESKINDSSRKKQKSRVIHS